MILTYFEVRIHKKKNICIFQYFYTDIYTRLRYAYLYISTAYMGSCIKLTYEQIVLN